MNTYTDKTPENKSQSAANAVAQKKSNGTNSVIVDNRPKSVLQRKIGDAISNNNEKVTQLSSHPKKASGTGMKRIDPGHGQVESKQHAAIRARNDGKREERMAAMRKRLQEKRAAEAAAKAAKKGGK